MSIVTTNDKNYSDIADAIRAKGVTGTFKPSEMATAVANISSGEEIYYTPKNVGYQKNTYANGTGLVSTNEQWAGAAYLESISLPECSAHPSGGLAKLLIDCPRLKSVFLPKFTALGRGMFTGSSALEVVQIGSIGYPVTEASNLTIFSPNSATITLYVDAETVEGIPASIKDNAPWGAGANATIVYRNSTTGEVLTE